MRRGTTKSRGRKDDLDRFYTLPHVARHCLEVVDGRYDLDGFTQVIEPSAGDGAFSRHVPGCLAMDISPGGPGIRKQDWLSYNQQRDPDGRVLVVGNPPFGQQGRTAVRFLNHSATLADVIAFILPLSFRKDSMISLLDRSLHLDLFHPLDPDSFTLDGSPRSVPCALFGFVRDPESPRPLPARLQPRGWRFVSQDESPDLAYRRVGGRTGEVRTAGLASLSPQTHVFIKMDEGAGKADRVKVLAADIEAADLSCRDWVVGPRSISKPELLAALAASGSAFQQPAPRST